MYLAIRDLKAATGRFTLVGVVIALVALMGVLLSGLATGLVDDGISGLRAQRFTHLVMQAKSAGVFSKSTLTTSETSKLDLDGVEHAELGVSFVNTRSSGGESFDLALFGVAPDSFLVPRADARAALERANSIVISQELADDGLKVGDHLTILGNEIELTVDGISQAGSYGHAPIAYTSLDTWQRAFYGNDARGRFSALALRSDSDPKLALGSDLELLTKDEAFDGSPGYAAETSTMDLIRFFLFLISALVVGAFFTVWTVQRTREIGLMKALGASDGYVVRDALGQLAIVIIAATLVGSLLGYGLGLLVPGGVPFSLQPISVLAGSALLVAVGMIGSVLTIRRISRVDPLIALGR